MPQDSLFHTREAVAGMPYDERIVLSESGVYDERKQISINDLRFNLGHCEKDSTK